MKSIPSWITILVVLVIVALVLWYFHHILICFVLAGLLSLMLKPFYDWIKKIQIGRITMPSTVAAMFTLTGVIFVFGAMVWLLLPLVAEQIKNIQAINLNHIMADLRGPLLRIEKLMIRLDLLPADDELSLRLYVQTKISELLEWIDYTSLIESLFKATGHFVMMTFSTIFMLFFFLKEEDLFIKIIALLVPSAYQAKLHSTMNNIRNMLFRYLLGIVIQVACIALIVSVSLQLMNIKSALLIGILAGLLNIIPYLGPPIGFLTGFTLAVIAHLQEAALADICPIAWKMLGVFISMQIIDNYLLQPLIFSKSTHSHPLEIFIVILASSTLAGITGMIVAVPIYTIVRIVIFEFFSDTTLIQRLKNLR